MATVEQVARVLDEHRSKPTGSPYCICGWRPGLMLNDTESDRQQHVAHQAEMLAALDEPTHTEWGVVNPADTKSVIVTDDEDEARDISKPDVVSFEVWPVVARQVTEWRRVDE